MPYNPSRDRILRQLPSLDGHNVSAAICQYGSAPPRLRVTEVGGRFRAALLRLPVNDAALAHYIVDSIRAVFPNEEL